MPPQMLNMLLSRMVPQGARPPQAQLMPGIGGMSGPFNMPANAGTPGMDLLTMILKHLMSGNALSTISPNLQGQAGTMQGMMGNLGPAAGGGGNFLPPMDFMQNLGGM